MPRKVTEEKTSAPLTEMREENRASAGDIPVICRRMRYYRLKQHIGQKELGLMIGASANTVNNWEMGRSRPDVSFLPAIIQALGISFEEIYGIRKPDEQIREEKRAEEEELLLKLYRKLDRGNKYAAERMIRTLLVVQKGNEQQRLRPVMELPLITRSLAAGVGDPTEFEENTEPFYLYRPDGGEEQGAGGPYAKRNAAERADRGVPARGEAAGAVKRNSSRKSLHDIYCRHRNRLKPFQAVFYKEMRLWKLRNCSMTRWVRCLTGARRCFQRILWLTEDLGSSRIREFSRMERLKYVKWK